jgi:uncharacterized protein YidB (DUF937 family)
VNLTDTLGKIGGQQGQQGGVATITQLFGNEGLQGIVSTMRSNGMGKQVQSWIANGKNLPISGADVKRCVDPSALSKTAQQQGMTPDELADHVARALPQLIDQATPNGQVPKQGGNVDALVGMLKK